jgi:hypothetical protein
MHYKNKNTTNGITLYNNEVIGFNGNEFVRYFLTKIKIAVLQIDKIRDNIYYYYSRKNVWEKMNENDVNKRLETLIPASNIT